MTRVLLVEDEPRAAQILAMGLREHGYTVDLSANGHEALHQARSANYDAIVLDVMLPGIDGLAVCSELRGQGSQVPVLMLTARDDVEARIAGLDSGADDYLVKPFDFSELLARLRAVIRRGHFPLTPVVITLGPLTMNFRSRQAFRNDVLLNLTAREYALLEYLVVHAGHVVGRGAIADHVFDDSFEFASNVIDVLVQRVRRKIDAPGGPSLITARRGEGYVLEAPAA